MQLEGGPKKLEIGKKRAKVEKEISLPAPAEEIGRDVQKLLAGKRRISKGELPLWLRDLVKEREEILEIIKEEFSRDTHLYFQDKKGSELGTRIRIRMMRITPPKVEIKVSKKGEEIFPPLFLEDELAKEIKEATGILAMTKDKKGNWVILRKGREMTGFNYIKKVHFSQFEKKLGIKTEEELQKLIVHSVENAQSVGYDKKGVKFYRYQTVRGDWIQTRVNPQTNTIIDSFIEK